MALYRLDTAAMMTPVGEEMVLLNSLNGHYFSLDPVGRTMLDMALAEADRVSVIAKLVSRYDVSRERITRDFMALMEELESVGLVVADD